MVFLLGLFEDVILQLAHDKEVYRTALYSAAERISELEEQIKRHEEDIKDMVPLALLSNRIEHQFRSGNIPIPPSLISDQGRSIEVSCNLGSIEFSRASDNFATCSVSFRHHGLAGEYVEYFRLVLVPGMTQSRHAYPSFRLSYVNVTPAVPAKKRVRTRKKAAVATPPTGDVTIVKVVNTTPPTDTLS